MASAVVGSLRVLLEANAANLEATFSKATVTVGDFDRFSKNAVRNLAQQVAQFSGQRIVQEAAAMATAIQKVGGVSVLTEQELKRVSSTVDQAAAKLRAMGAEVPPSIAKLHGEIQALGRHTTSTTAAIGTGGGGLTGALKSLGPLLPVTTIAGAVTAVVGLGRAALQSADQIVTLSNKTGLSVERIQQFQHVAGETGTTVDALAAASFKLGVNIENGTTKTRDAIAKLGLAYDDLRKQSPEQQFDTVIAKLEGVASETERNAIGAALFGNRFSEVAGIVAEGYTRMKDEAVTSTEEQIRALEAAGDAIDRFQRNLSAGFTSAFGSTLLWIEAVERGSDSLSNMEKAGMFLRSGGLFGPYLQELREVGQGLIEAEKRQESFSDAVALMKRHTETTAVSVEDYSKRLADARKEVAALSDAQRTQLNDALELGGTAATEYADKIGLSEDALRLYQSSLRESAKALKEHEKDTEAAEKAQQKFLDSIKNTTPALTPFFTALRQGIQDSGDDLQNIAAGFEADGTIIVRTIREAAIATGEADKATREWANATGAVLMPALKDTRDGVQQAAVETRSWQDNLSRLATSFAQMAQVSDGAFGRIASGIGRVITSIDTAVKSVQSMRDGLAQLASGNLLSGILGFASGITGIVGAVANLVRGWFGVSQEVIRARGELEDYQDQLRDGLTDTQRLEAGTEGWRQDVVRVRDAFIAVGRSEAEALAIVRQLWDTDNPDAMRRAMEEINRVLAEEKRLADDATRSIEEQRQAFEDAKQEAGGLVDEIADLADQAGELPKSMLPYIDRLREVGLITDEQAQRLRGLAGAIDWEEMQQAAERFGIDLGSLGARFQGARIGATAQDIINVFGQLTRGGADVGGVLQGMSDEISQLVRDSLRFGTEIPRNMRPWIEELARTGQLLDANGNKITNLDKISWGEEMKDEATIAREGFQSIIEKIQELIDRITGPLTQALDKITEDRTIHVDVEFNDPPIPRDLFPGRNVPFEEFGRGGIVTRPTLALIGEKGPEMVIPIGSLPSFDIPIPRVPFGSEFDRTDLGDGNRAGGGVVNNHYSSQPVAVFHSSGPRLEDTLREVDAHFANQAIGTGPVRESLTSLIDDRIQAWLTENRLRYGL